MELEIGRGKTARQAYGFDDIAIVPSRRTRDPRDVDISWSFSFKGRDFDFPLPVLASAMDGVVDPAFAAGAGSREQCLAAIRKYHKQYDYLLDPHTAVGVSVAEACGLAGDPVICLATAHPAKFPEAIRQAVGSDLAHHPSIDAVADLPTRCEVVPSDKEAVRQYMVEIMAQGG